MKKILFIFIIFIGVLFISPRVFAAKSVRYAPSQNQLLPPPTEGQANLENNTSFQTPDPSNPAPINTQSQNSEPNNPSLPNGAGQPAAQNSAEESIGSQSHWLRNSFLILLFLLAVIFLTRNNLTNKNG